MSLSDKRFKIHNFPKRETYNYTETDVKEFIKKLKKLTEGTLIHSLRCEEIDKLAGDDLTVEKNCANKRGMIDWNMMWKVIISLAVMLLMLGAFK